MVYLDNAATTRPIVAFREVEEILREAGITDNLYRVAHNTLWLNSHSSYSKGDYLLWVCREKISKILNCKPNEVLFTSGGCEGNSLLINALYNIG